MLCEIESDVIWSGFKGGRGVDGRQVAEAERVRRRILCVQKGMLWIFRPIQKSLSRIWLFNCHFSVNSLFFSLSEGLTTFCK